jgi:enoyl-CoA hydratase/carnithine racemase
VSEAPRDEAFELAREIAHRSPDAVRAAKRLLGESDGLGIRGRLELEAQLQRTLIGEPNQIEAVHANLEQRAPRFEDPK